MCGIKDKEIALFEEWIKHERWTGYSNEELNDSFCWDGLHFTGAPSVPLPRLDGGFYRIMNPDDNQDKIWEKAYLKPVFLCKDHNGAEWVDVREETGYSNERFYHQFYGKFLMLLYALTNYNPKENTFPSFEESCDINNSWLGDRGFFHAPVVRINLKKVFGSASCGDFELNKFIENDFDFITRQKNIYKGANIFVCCHGGESFNPIMDLLKKWFPDMKPYKNSGFLWCDVSNKVVVLHEWHMSCCCISYKRYFGAISVLREFLGENPGFFVK